MTFRGCYTALVTPFRGGKVDYAALEKLLDFQAESGVDGVVPCGTTGESPTLTQEEQRAVIEFVIEKALGRFEVVAGTGFNATAKTVEMTRFAERAGADGALLVTPYYNRPTQEGLYRHFAAVAEAAKLRLMLYNIPSRSAVALAPETVARLHELDPVVAIKEASGDLNFVNQIRAACGITILSGDDALTLPMMSLGAQGVVSVASNLMPVEVVSLVRAALEGDGEEALRLHERLLPLLRTLFLETNPIGIKAALAMAGRLQEELRLPLTPLSPSNRPRLQQALEKLGLLEPSGKTAENRKRSARKGT